MIAATELRLVLVTPETTLLDRMVRSIQFPLFDGQIGVLPGRTPLVGRLGLGELKYTSSEGEGRFFIDGGFAQIKGQVVTILTHSAQPVDAIDAAAAEAALESANALKPTTEDGFAEKQHALDRARKLIELGRR
ncbi:MAG: F0F1 ATP synthase subunit epsilon [Planctomycetaceae bacterium]|nr:F0F1 ATP synthase subunit epsilon [Planctomycetaceae bacterium]